MRLFGSSIDIRLSWSFQECPYNLVEVEAGVRLSGHFFSHKGEEAGYLLKGELRLTMDNRQQSIRAGEIVFLARGIPSGWEKKGKVPARMLWITLR